MKFRIVCVGGYSVLFDYPDLNSNKELVDFICEHKVKWLSDTKTPVSVPVDKIVCIHNAEREDNEE